MVKKLTLILLGFVALAAVFPTALNMGIRWDSQAYPTVNVSVVLNNGNHITGKLSKSWEGQFIIETEKGHLYRFDDFKQMVLPPVEAVDELNKSIFTHWRRYLPITATAVAWVLLVVMVLPVILKNGTQRTADQLS